MGGYYLIEAKNLDEAMAIAARIPGARHGSIEVRPDVAPDKLTATAIIADERGRASGGVEEYFAERRVGCFATLIRLLGDFDLAEEAQQDAFAAALEQWPVHGTPLNPRAWLIKTGRNKAIDRIRRDTTFRTKIAERELAAAAGMAADRGDTDEAIFGDDRLRLIFTCCHPALNGEAQIALTLREVCGLTTQAVAARFLSWRGNHGTAAGAREEKNPRRRHSVRDTRIHRCWTNV